MVKDLEKCVRYGGKLIKDDGERKCFSCGRTHEGKKERNQYYEEHKVEILKDLKTIGRGKTCKKWQIPQGSMSRILNRWLGKKAPALVPVPVAQPDNHLPELPAFSNDWTPRVQVKWLEIWGQRINTGS